MRLSDPPKRVVVATDLSARCDRALARAALLAGAWHAQLTVVHAVGAAEAVDRDRLASMAPSSRRPDMWMQALQQRLVTDLDAERIAATARIVLGSPANAVQQVTDEVGAGLVVLGIAKAALMDRIQLGSTVDALVRHARMRVLNVRSRARAAYRHVVVATDFSASSLRALRLAARWFPTARLTVFHAYTPPHPAATRVPGVEEAWRGQAVRDCEACLSEAGLPDEAAAALQRLVEPGEPEALLPDFVASAAVDLVVLGSEGRSGLSRALLGSTAENLLHALDCDTLVVRGG